MARRVFFSFHYDDVWRVNQVRNCWVVRRENEMAGFVDAAEFEAVRRRGEAAIKAWIDAQLHGTSVTVVLIGTETATRPYVHYEIEQSRERGNGLLGIWIHNIQDMNRRTAAQGRNPFAKYQVQGLFGPRSLASDVPTYDWVHDAGRENIGRWVEAVAPRPKTSW